MSEVVKRLRERRLSVWNEARTLADLAAENKRSFTSEEQQNWDTLNAEIDSLDKRAQALIEGEKRAQDTADAFAKLEGRPAERAHQAGENRSAELRSFLLGQSGERFYDVKPEQRDLSKLTAAAGADTVPTSFYNRLVQHMIEVSAILQAGPTVLSTSGGEPIDVPKTTAHGTAAITPEADPIPEDDPAFDKVTLGAYKYGDLIQVSRELVDDSGVDLEGYLAVMAGRAVGNALGAHLVTGTGSSQPRGVMLDATTGFTPDAGLLAGGGFGDQATADQGFDILINVYHSVIAPYRSSPSCAWLMNDTTAAQVRKIKDSEGRYAWQPSVIVGQPDTILSKPVVIDPFVADVGASAKSIAFGDFRAYFVRYAGGFRFERSDDYAFGNDLVTFRALRRADGALVDTTGAVKTLTHPAT